MITNPTVIWIHCVCAALLSAAAAAPFVFRHLTPTWRKATPFGRFLFCLAALALTLFAGPKTNSVDTAGGETNIVDGAGGVTNGVDGAGGVLGAPLRRMAFAPSIPNYDFELVDVTTNEVPSYAMPSNGRVRGTWHLTGAYQAVQGIDLEGFGFPLGENYLTNVWVHSWGKVRQQLRNAENEIAAVDAPMSAIPGTSRFWTAATTNDTYLLTWENFAAERIAAATNSTELPPASLLSAQIELFPSGNFVTRTNGIEQHYIRHVPGVETEGYGPHQPEGIEETTNAYYTIDLVVGNADARVVFTGDGPSNLPDPNFIARADETNRIELLIGKTYTIQCCIPFTIVGTSDPRVEVNPSSPTAASVVWPVEIDIEYANTPLRLGPLLAAPPKSRPQGTWIHVDPDNLNGIVSMSDDTCCGVTGADGEFQLGCIYGDCGCDGCIIGGTYAYEGYELAFGGWECGCTPSEDESKSMSTFGFSIPDAVFKDGALRTLNVWFNPGDDDDNSGWLVLSQTQGQDKVRIWADERKTAQASQFSWPVEDGVFCTYYIEGVRTSDSVDDIEFMLQWVKDDGPEPDTQQMTCAEVLRTEVTSDLPDGSPNRQPFAGHTNWEFNVTHSPNPDKHYSVLFRDVVNADFSVRDFSVTMTLVVQPTGAPVGTASWFPLSPTPDTATVVGTGERTGELRNPKVGGVYHIASCFSGSPTNECNIVLPLAGASVEDILLEDLARADEFAAFVRSRLDEKQINTVQFGLYFFWDAGRGDYLGRPDNLDLPTVWSYNQVTTSGRQFGKGAVTTLFGLPIRISKLSNLLAAYTCDRLGVYQELQNLSQWIGTRNDDSSLISWNCGTALAHGSNYVHSVSTMARQCWNSSDAKAAKLWPNTSDVDNHAAAVYYGDVERFFYSPGMLYFLHH